MADSYEYKIIIGYFIFYAVLVFILGQLGIATAQAKGVEDVGTFEGLKIMFGAPFENAGVMNVLYFMFLTSPLILFVSMMTINLIRGR